MAAEHPLRIASTSVGQRSGGYLAGQAQPHRIKAFQEAHDPLVSERDFLKRMMECRKKIAEQAIVDEEAIKLMAMDGQMSKSAIIPLVLLVYLNSHQVRHYF